MNTQPQSPPWVVTADRLVCICGCCLANVYWTNLNVNNSLPGVCFGTALAACSRGQVVKFMAFKRSSMYQCVVCYRQMVLLFLCNRVCVCVCVGIREWTNKVNSTRKESNDRQEVSVSNISPLLQDANRINALWCMYSAARESIKSHFMTENSVNMTPEEMRLSLFYFKYSVHYESNALFAFPSPCLLQILVFYINMSLFIMTSWSLDLATISNFFPL